MDRKTILVDTLHFCRSYTNALLDAVPVDQWFTMPPGCPTHVAWQVGHITIAEARLLIDRVCGRNCVEEGIIPKDYLAMFGRLSAAETEPGKYPSAVEIRQSLDRVHQITLESLAKVNDADLDAESPGFQHRLCKTRFEFLRWAPQHEMVHNGQIGLLRRMLGLEILW